MNAAAEMARLNAVLHAAGRDLSDLNDPRALQRAAWLVDLAVEMVDDLTLQAEQREAAE